MSWQRVPHHNREGLMNVDRKLVGWQRGSQTSCRWPARRFSGTTGTTRVSWSIIMRSRLPDASRSAFHANAPTIIDTATAAAAATTTTTTTVSTTITTVLWLFFRNYPGEPVPEKKFVDFMVQGTIKRGRHTDHPAGHHSIRTNQCPPPPSPHFLQTGCPSCQQQ